MVLGDKMVSIIVPVYKVEEYLPRCIESLINQTYKDIEIILVDDGSPDNCPKFCDEYAKKDGRIKVIHKQNEGVSKARNCAIHYASGEYLLFVDSDDWVDENYVNNLYLALTSTNSDMSACLFCKTDGTKKRRFFDKNVEIVEDKKFYYALTEENYAGYAWNKMFKTSIIKENQIEFDLDIALGEDSVFTAKYIAQSKKVAFIKQDLYYYFFRKGSVTHSAKMGLKHTTILKSREKVLTILENEKSDYYDLCLASYIDHLAKSKYFFMKKEEYREQLKEADKKIKDNKKKIFHLKHVPFINKVKLCLMVNFPNTCRALFKRRFS